MIKHQILEKGFLFSFIPTVVGFGAFGWFQQNESRFLQTVVVFISILITFVILCVIGLHKSRQISSIEKQKAAERNSWFLFIIGVLFNVFWMIVFILGTRANFWSPNEKPIILIGMTIASLIILAISFAAALIKGAKSATSIN